MPRTVAALALLLVNGTVLAACRSAPAAEPAAGATAGPGPDATATIIVEPDAPLDRPAATPAGAPDGRVPGPPVRASNLQRALDGVDGPVVLSLRPGRYHLLPRPFTDPTCGNCEDPATPISATVGLHLTTPGVRITGPHADSVIIRTHAGYGLLFDGCDGCALEGVTVTGGVRSPDGRATDGAVVVRGGRVRLEACALRDNIGDSATVAATVVGIAGVVGREASDVVIDGCRITRNSWDGVALYRGARAVIRGTVIDGVDAARGARVGGGRGVGIGATWDATATVRGSLVRNYWKGIGAFVDAEVDARENIVEEILTWGLAHWGAGGGAARATFRDNAVYRTGACGVMVARETPAAEGEAPGALVGNAFVATGLDERYDGGEPYCWQRPIARHAVPAGFVIADNLVHDVRQPGEAWPIEPVIDRAAFDRAVAPLVARLSVRPALGESSFLAAFPRRRPAAPAGGSP